MWVPCIGALLYLSGSLLLFKFGPIDWPVQDESKFWAFNALYLSMFFVGYAFAFWRRHLWAADETTQSSLNFTERMFWPIWVCAALVILIGHRNLTMGPSYIPTTLFSDFITGLVTPQNGYLYKLSDEAKANFSGNPPVTLLFGMLSFSKLVLVYMLVSNWPRMSLLKKVLGCTIAIFPIISGVVVGTNKPVFDIAFSFSFIILAYVLITPSAIRRESIKARIPLIALTLFIILFAGAYFQHTMNVRAGGLEYAKSLSPNKESSVEAIRVKPSFQEYCETSDPWVLKGCHFFSIGTIYLTQGYFGMSLSTAIPHETTYGLGHSKFFIEALRKYSDIDLAPKTFQQKIDEQWSATAQWHSAYSQWANDVGFPGVALVMLALGFYVCAIWTSALTTHNVAAVCSIPLLAILIFFIPANNQVFNIFESLTAFIALFIAWLGSLMFGVRTRVSLLKR
jgi:hypothetical protein